MLQGQQCPLKPYTRLPPKFQTKQSDLPAANNTWADTRSPDLDLANSQSSARSVDNISLLAVDGNVVNTAGRRALAAPEDEISGLSCLARNFVAFACFAGVLSLGSAG